VTDYRFSRDIDRVNIFGQYNMPLRRWGSGFESAVFSRFGYTRTNIDIRESGSLTNVPLDFASTVDFGVNTYTPGLGVLVTFLLSPNVALNGHAWAGPAFSHASGRDGFAFRGFFTGVQQNNISENHVGFAGEVAGGIVISVGNGNSVSLTGSYLTSDSYPVVVRTGEANERSRIAFEDQQAFKAIAKWQRSFYP
jgi:hypothetical protein